MRDSLLTLRQILHSTSPFSILIQSTYRYKPDKSKLFLRDEKNLQLTEIRTKPLLLYSIYKDKSLKRKKRERSKSNVSSLSKQSESPQWPPHACMHACMHVSEGCQRNMEKRVTQSYKLVGARRKWVSFHGHVLFRWPAESHASSPPISI